VARALYRKYRSKSLDEIIGQKHITDILSQALARGRLSHAYLLSGPRGVGKTSVARILAHEINGIEYNENTVNLDIIEIDAASNNGVEDVRELREKVQIAPFSAKKKIYIIDEVHMLSKAAFNALLKTIEEPPEHVVFILATTNAEKLPATIISRVQRFSFRPISIEDAIEHLEYIAKKEKIKISKDALKLIAKRSDGSFRDSISLLDQLSSLVKNGDKEITVKLIEDLLGLAPTELIDQLLESVEQHDVDKLIKLLNRSYDDGIDGTIIINQLTGRIRERIASQPEFLPLLDSLIDATKSPQPQLKLISVLGMAASTTPKAHSKTAALAATTHEISMAIPELEEQATKDKPHKPKKQPKSEKLDWDKLIEYTRQNHVALFSVLSKCGYDLSGNDLTIYTNNKFYKKKLDDTRYTSLLHECLQQTGVFGLDIHTIPTSVPPKDSQAAAVAAIMGGGVEVSVETSQL